MSKDVLNFKTEFILNKVIYYFLFYCYYCIQNMSFDFFYFVVIILTLKQHSFIFPQKIKKGFSSFNILYIIYIYNIY